MQQKQSTSIVWYTDNLRARDNFVLSAAMKASRRVIGVYFLTPERFNETQFGFDPTLKVNAGDDVVFNVNSPGHPFF